MKIHVIQECPRSISSYTLPLFNYTLQDLGYCCKDIDKAEIIIAFYKFPSHIKKEKGKRYILLQTEQRLDIIQKNRKFQYDEMWGFNISDKSEKYICLGYHPRLDNSSNDTKEDIDISFLGAITRRREKFFKQLNHNVSYITEYNLVKKSKLCIRSKINLDLKSYYPNNEFTCWDRLSFLITNKCFVLIEKTYVPLNHITMFEKNNHQHCSDLINLYLYDSGKRKNNREQLHEEFKRDFDMRKILTNLLKKNYV